MKMTGDTSNGASNNQKNTVFYNGDDGRQMGFAGYIVHDKAGNVEYVETKNESNCC